MSQVLTWTSVQRALLAVNTECWDPISGSVVTWSKAYVWHHARTILTSRANAMLPALAFWQMQLSAPIDFDDIARGLPAALSRASGQVMAMWGVEKVSALAEQQGNGEFILVGWSASERRMRLLEFGGDARDPASFALRAEHRPQYVAPWAMDARGAAARGQVPPMSSVNAMVSAARATKRLLAGQFDPARFGPTGALGGELQVFEIERDRITTTMHPL